MPRMLIFLSIRGDTGMLDEEPFDFFLSLRTCVQMMWDSQDFPALISCMCRSFGRILVIRGALP